MSYAIKHGRDTPVRVRPRVTVLVGLDVNRLDPLFAEVTNVVPLDGRLVGDALLLDPH